MRRPLAHTIGAELFRAAVFAIFMEAGIFFLGVALGADWLYSPTPWIIGAVTCAAYVPYGVALHRRIEKRLQSGQNVSPLEVLWITDALTETIRGMALFGISVFVVAPVVFYLFGEIATAVAVVAGWIIGLAWMPLATRMIDHEKTQLGPSNAKQLVGLVVAETAAMLLVGGALARIEGASLRALARDLLAGLLVIGLTVVWGRRRIQRLERDTTRERASGG